MKFVFRSSVRRRARVMLTCACAWLGTVPSPADPVPTEINSFRQFYNLTPDQAHAAVPVRIKGIVLGFDAGWNQLYVHDGAETAWLSPTLFQTNLLAGLEVELTGSTTAGQGGTAFTNLHLRVLGQGQIPPAKNLEIPQLAGDYGQWVEITGQVKVTETSAGRLGLVIQDKGQNCLVYVMGFTNDCRSLRGCSVRIRGINSSQTTGGKLRAASVFAPAMSTIVVLGSSGTGTQPPDDIPATSIEALLDRKPGPWTNDPVHLEGSLTAYKPGESLVVRDFGGSIRADVIQTTEIPLDTRVEVWGYLAISQEGPFLRDACFEVQTAGPAKTSPTSSWRSATATPGPDQEITRFSQVSKLRPEQAAKAFQVRLQGTITYADADWRICFFQGADGAICIDLNQNDVRAGQWVEVAGQTGPGGFAPEVINTSIRVLTNTNLPEPVRADLEDLASGTLDAHWVEVEGVVRRITPRWGHITLMLTTPTGRFEAIMPKPNDQAMPTELIDALVSIRGACTSKMNARGQLTGIVLHTPSREQITILEPEPANPFAVPAIAIGSVATFDPTRLAGRRVKVSGTVTHLLPGQGFFVQDVSGGIRVNCQQTNSLQIGDAVDVLGFPAIHDFSPYLEDISFQRTGPASLPKPERTTPEEVLVHGAHDATLVQVEGQLVQNIQGTARMKLMLQSGPIIFTAILDGRQSDRKITALKIGSLLRLVGVCSIQGGENHEPETFRLLVGGPQDVVLLRSPPWWTIRHTFILTGSLALGILVAWGWSSSLRRRVKAQTEIIRRNEQELITVSRQAGMAEVATSVLHNVGNVLNSVNVSATLAADGLRESKAAEVSQVAALMKEKAATLGDFITQDARGRKLPEYLEKLGQHLLERKRFVLAEMQSLASNIEHIKDIVATQQSHAQMGGVTEKVKVTDLIGDALRMNGALAGRNLKIVREFEAGHAGEIVVERHKVLQILVNLISNAKNACAESGRAEQRLTIRLARSAGRVKITLADNGVGIPSENLTRIFSHGFTTRKSGHGFGLHSAALVAQELGGSLQVESKGPGMGATFVLELPLAPEPK